MLSYIWPIALVVVSNTVYQICAKSVPEKVSPFASLGVTYLVGAVVCFVLYFVSHPGENVFKQFAGLNWASYGLGVVIVGLEVGWIYAYKAGWQVSVGSIVQSAFLAVMLVLVGFLLYKEAITWNKIVGIIVCLVGLVFINLK